MMPGVSVLVQDGKIADIGAKLVAPKGMKIVEGKGLRLYPGMIDSNTELGLSEVSAERVTVDTGELGEFMPQLKALSAVNPESAHFSRGACEWHHQRHDVSSSGWTWWTRRRGSAVHFRPGRADPYGRLDVGRHGN